MKEFNDCEFWFVTGSQHLYGEDTLMEVKLHAEAIVKSLNSNAIMPSNIVCKPVVKESNEVEKLIKEAANDDRCSGIITWMHTFSPAKMWINGLNMLNKPLLHFHTQFNRDIPESIDMEFMNTNQSAHGDREYGFITARMRLARKVVVGHYEDDTAIAKIASWMRSAKGAIDSRKLKAVRFGDNMRNVAVTEGDKVEAQIKLGWSVNTYGVGTLVNEIAKVTQHQIDEMYAKYIKDYTLATNNIESVKYQIKMKLAMEKFFTENGYTAFTNTFEDLYGLEQLPGLATQLLMKKGYGFGAEGDWKTACLLRVMKQMAKGRTGGTTLMEDYTYHLEKGNEMILGAHMLEICPSIASGEIKIVVAPLGIGGKNAPARLVFEGRAGKAICVSLTDMGGRLRMTAMEVECQKPILEMKNLPVARAMWKPLPDFATAAEAWILAGGSHHTVLSYDLSSQEMSDFAEIMGIEFININNDTKIGELKNSLMISDLVWKLM